MEELTLAAVNLVLAASVDMSATVVVRALEAAAGAVFLALSQVALQIINLLFQLADRGLLVRAILVIAKRIIVIERIALNPVSHIDDIGFTLKAGEGIRVKNAVSLARAAELLTSECTGFATRVLDAGHGAFVRTVDIDHSRLARHRALRTVECHEYAIANLLFTAVILRALDPVVSVCLTLRLTSSKTGKER